MSGDKGRMLTNENISKTVKTKTAKTKPKMPSKFQKVNKNQLGSQSPKTPVEGQRQAKRFRPKCFQGK